MGVRINRVQCRVTVRRGERSAQSLFQGSHPPRPEMEFLMPTSMIAQETPPAPAQTLTGRQEAGIIAAQPAAGSVLQARSASARAVADRVYDLMREDIRRSRWRSGR